MQITSTTNTNWIANPNFSLGLAGWSVAGGSLNWVTSPTYSGSNACQLVPSGVYGFADYALIGMQTGMTYIAQARVMASAGQQVFIQFSNGGAGRYVASGGWDLIISQPMVQTGPAFSVQIGIGSAPQLNVGDSVTLTESTTLSVNYGVNKQNIVVGDSITTKESLQLSTLSVIGQSYLYDLNINVGDTINSAESYGVNNFASDLNISVADSSITAESYNVGSFKSALLVKASDSANVYDSFFAYNSVMGLNFISDLNLSVNDNVITSESYKVGSFVSGSVVLISAADSITTYESVYPQAQAATGNAIYIDNVMLEQNSAASTYFDGDSGNGYHWTGLAGASTSIYRQWELAADNHSSIPDYGVLISWTRQTNSSYAAFTIGSSVIGGPDYIPGTSTFPTYFNQYSYGEYSTYLTGMQITKNIGQFPYGAFGAQLDLTLDNSTFLFLPGYDPTIGNYIINGRPVMFQTGYNGELIALFSGISTKPANDIKNRTMSMTAFDGMDYLNSFVSKGAGPIAAATNGYYANIAAQNIIADLLEEAGFSTAQYYAEQSLQSNIGFLAPKGNTIGAIIQSICEAEQALFFFDENGVPNFWNRNHIPTNNAIQWKYAYKSILDYQTEDTPIINDVIITAKPRVVQAKQNIWQLTSPVTVNPSSTTNTITNLAINPNFISTSGGYFNSPEQINVQENVTTQELVFSTFWPYNTRLFPIDSTQASEAVTVTIQNAAFKPYVTDSTYTTEQFSVKVGTNAAYNSPYNVSVGDTVTTQELVYVIHLNYRHIQLVFLDSTQTSEAVSVAIVNAALKPSVYDSVTTDEDYNISTFTMFGWSTNNAWVVRNQFDEAPVTTVGSCGQLTTQGGSNSYLTQTYTVTTATQYVSQMYVKAPGGTNVTAQIIQNGHQVTSASISASGGWDLLQIPGFTTENTATTMQLRVYTDVAVTMNIGAVMTQKGVGASSTYFDGSSSPSSSFVYSWTGAANQSTSLATPCGSVTIEADFQDDDGDLPVTSVTAPTYNNANLDSTYLTNLNSDNSGLTANAYIQLQSTTLNGSKYLMTFINTYTQPIYITQLSLYGTPAKVVYTISQEYSDPTSIVLYGTNPTNNGQPLEIANDLIQDPSTAQSDAYILVNDYSKPYQRIVANVFPNYALQIGDAIQATIDDTGQSLTYTVVGITNTISDQGEPGQELELEIKKIVHYFTINQSAIGGTDSIAP